MKIRNLLLLFISAILTVSLIACDSSKKEDSNYKINFISNGGSVVTDIEASASKRITAPTDPSKNGYSFAGWYTDSSLTNKFQFTYMPSENLTLYAKWTLKSYTISYEVGNGINNSENPTIYNVLQNDIMLIDPECNGFYFDGWYLDETFTEEIEKIETSSATNYTLYAKWAKEEVITTYNIIYHLNGGVNEDNPSTFNKTDYDIVLLNPTRNGYTFKGWYTEETFTNKINKIITTTANDINLYAKWEETVVIPDVETYTITYYLNGGTNGNNPIRYTEDTEDIVLVNPTKLSCTFKGWYTDASFEHPITTIDCSQKKNVEIYAKWLDGITEVKYEFDFGIGHEYTLFHISDTHINAGTSSSDLSAEAGWMTGRYSFAKSFGEQYSERNLFKSSTDTFEAFVNYINNQKPTAVCFTGDLMDYYSVSNYNYINETLPTVEVPYVYALGNHENPSTAYSNMAGISTTAFTVLDFNDFEIVCLDDSCTDSNGNYSFSEEQYNLLKAETDKNKPIIIATHVPLLTEENCDSRIEDCGSYYFIDENSCSVATKKVVDLICNNDNIKMVLCGHVHGGTLTYIAPNKPQITCSSGLIGVINIITIR